MTINELLDIYEKDFAMTEAEKGERFERLMRNFLLTYPAWRGQIVEAWLWKDFPFRHDLGGKDLGIDIVAKTVDGEYWAAQCKFYADTSIIDKKAVDSFVSNSGRTFGGDKKFSRRLWISTTDNFTDNAREMLKNQSPAVEVINLEFLRRAQVNWILLDNGFARREARIIKRLRDYQWEALYKARAHYQANDRGRLIMACGTGKTFTALKIAEALAPEGLILFLVPSISLLSQTIEEWAANSVKPLNAVCVCSDETAAQDADEITDVSLPFKATTDKNKIADALTHLPADRFNVVFSTYQSLDKVAAAQGDSVFDLIICDEAHRTTGSSKDAATQFTAVHDNDNIKAKRRMYMTATPRMFTSDAIKKAAAFDINVWSMDDPKTYGAEFYRLNFGDAVAKKILSDYKVLVLTLNEKKSADKHADDATKIAGTINALAKKMTHISQGLATVDPAPMHTAVAFCPTIADSKRIAATFDAIADKKRDLLDVHTEHVDGSQSGKIRNGHLSWLKTTPVDGNACRILIICVPGLGGRRGFSTIIISKLSDLNVFESGTQCFPLYWYEAAAQGSLFGENLQRRDGVTDFILTRAQNQYGGDVTREDVFYYVYGFLHLPAYRARFANELKKSLPRIILVGDAEKFWALSRAGRALAAIHLNYESQEPAQVDVIGAERGNFTVTKLKLSKDKTTLTYNRDITIKNIPPRSFEYVVNGRSPLEWIIDRYNVKTDKASGIVNDANAWGLEHDNPRYILDLILSCITVSLKTLDIVDALPAVDFDG